MEIEKMIERNSSGEFLRTMVAQFVAVLLHVSHLLRIANLPDKPASDRQALIVHWIKLLRRSVPLADRARQGEMVAFRRLVDELGKTMLPTIAAIEQHYHRLLEKPKAKMALDDQVALIGLSAGIAALRSQLDLLPLINESLKARIALEAFEEPARN